MHSRGKGLYPTVLRIWLTAHDLLSPVSMIRKRELATVTGVNRRES